jgi:class 3 adenylate cyclase
VVAIFGDLRGFTAFSARAEPDVVIAVLREYYEAIGTVTARHAATLIRFAGDGVMVLVNAPVACENPAQRGIRLAIDMQAAVQSLANYWNARDCAIGFGVGIAMGPATVGTLGWHGRLDYTAIGNVVNLASRLCDLAADAQILVDPVVTGHVKDSIALRPSASGPSRATIRLWSFLRWFAASDRCRILAVSVSLPTFDPYKRGLEESRRSCLRQMLADFGFSPQPAALTSIGLGNEAIREPNYL